VLVIEHVFSLAVYMYDLIFLFLVASPNSKKAGDLIDKDISNDTSGDFKRLLVSAAQVTIAFIIYNCSLMLFTENYMNLGFS
jgi:hypothetical protein